MHSSPSSIADTIFSTYLNKYDSFDIIPEIRGLLQRIHCGDQWSGPNEAEGKFIIRCDKTKLGLATAALMIHNVFAKESLNISTKNNLLELISELIGFELPRYGAKEQQRNSILALVYPVSTLLEFDVCKKGDHVFVGKYQNQLVCPNKDCKTARGGKCLKKQCQNLLATDECMHGSKFRCSERVLQYRPMCVFLQRALKYNLYYRLLKSQISPSSIPRDLLQKRVAREQMEAMQNLWNSRTDIDKSKYKPLFLLFGIGYDGVKIFKKKSAHFCPLLITILNLPPFLRNKKGVGMFVTSIFDGQTGADYSDSEEFLLSKCVADEFRELEENGIEIPVVNESGEIENFYVFGRLILHSYDTRAFEPIMHISSTNAFEWCFMCGTVFGGNKKEVGNTCFIGTRGITKFDSILRQHGQSKQCCPRGHYGDHPSHSEYAVLPEEVIEIESFDHTEISSRSILNGHEINRLQPCCIGHSHGNEVQNMLKSKNVSWLHSDLISTKEFRDVMSQYIYFVHLDLRPRIPLHRTTNLEYYLSALRFFQQQAIRKLKIPEPYKGVKGIYAFAKLKHGDITKHVSWDPFHVFMNKSNHLIELWKGERANSPILRQYCYENKIHPSLYTVVDDSAKKKPISESLKGDEAMQNIGQGSSNSSSCKSSSEDGTIHARQGVWVIPTSVRGYIDEVINAIVIPTGSRDELQFNSIFSATGTLNGIFKIKILVVLMDIINFCVANMASEYPKAYLYLYKIISTDICKMMSRGFEDEAVDELVEHVAETVSLYEGMFPPSELLASTHQLVDIAAHLKTCGPIFNWWAINSERGVGDVAAKCPSAGKKIYVTAMYRDYQESDAILHEFCNRRSSPALMLASTISQAAIPRETCANGVEGNDYFIEEDDGDGSKDHTQPNHVTDEGAAPPEAAANGWEDQCRTHLLPSLQVDLQSLKYDPTNDSFIVGSKKTLFLAKDKIKKCEFDESEIILVLTALERRFIRTLGLSTSTKISASIIEQAIEKLSLDCACSLLFRLYLAYFVGKNTNNHFYQCFRSVVSEHDFSSTVPEFVIFLRLLHLTCCLMANRNIIRSWVVQPGVEPHLDTDRLQILSKGVLYHSDVVFVASQAQLFFDLQFSQWLNFYDSVYCNGVRLRSRFNKALDATGPQNSMIQRCVTSDRDHWYSTKAFCDSWCFIGNDVQSNETSVAQISVFFSVNFPNDDWLGCVPWAMYDRRPSLKNMSRPMWSSLHFVDLETCYTFDTNIIEVEDNIFPSVIAILPLSRAKNALRQIGIVDSAATLSKHFTSVDNKKNLTKKDNDDKRRTTAMERYPVDTLCLFALQPYNRVLKSIVK